MNGSRRVVALLAVAAAALAWSIAPAAPAAPAHPSTPATGERHLSLTPDEVQWGPCPPVLPAGAQCAVLQGDMNSPVLLTIRARFPDGYKIAPHWHPTEEHIVVLSGQFNVGMGDTFSQAGSQALSTGGFAVMPQKMHHFAWASGDTEIQINTMGPWALTYVNPEDDPRTSVRGSR